MRIELQCSQVCWFRKLVTEFSIFYGNVQLSEAHNITKYVKGLSLVISIIKYASVLNV